MVPLLYFLCLFGLLGSVDIVYFHLYRYRLYQSLSSRAEQGTHLLRLALYPLMMIWVLFIRASGWIAAGLLTLLIMDLLNGFLDAYLEPQSRKPLGGLPKSEYLLHMILMALAGAILWAAIEQCSALWNQPAGWKWQLVDAPRWARMLGFQLAVGSLLLFMIEGFGFLTSALKSRKA